jgi:iron(III) transport system ATP-binding protein
MTPSSDAIAVVVERVSKRFAHRVKGEVYAAREVSLAVQPGEFVTLLGPSGCGKTTTLRMIAGFEQPDEGRIAFGGQDMTRVPANQRNIGFVFQNYALFPHLTVFDNVAYGLQVRKQAPDVVARAVTEVLGLVGLAGYEQQFPAQLSGGEQQRVALARAIVIRPRVLLFDEPLSNLDAKLRVQMRSEIRDLQQRLSITTIYVTHDQEEAMAVSDRIAVMERGSIVQQGSAEELYRRPATLFVAQFIGRTNVLPGRVEKVSDEGAQISVLGASIGVRDAPRTLQAEQPVRVLVRPEAIRVLAPGAGACELSGRVLSRTFLGEKTEYVIACGDHTLNAVQSGALTDRVAVGATVPLAIDTSSLTLLALEGGAPAPAPR